MIRQVKGVSKQCIVRALQGRSLYKGGGGTVHRGRVLHCLILYSVWQCMMTPSLRPGGFRDRRCPQGDRILFTQGGICVPSQMCGGKFCCGDFAEAPGFCVVNFADTPRNVVVCRALQARWSLATGANFAENPGFCVGNFAANLKRAISHTKLTASEFSHVGVSLDTWHGGCQQGRIQLLRRRFLEVFLKERSQLQGGGWSSVSGGSGAPPPPLRARCGRRGPVVS